MSATKTTTLAGTVGVAAIKILLGIAGVLAMIGAGYLIGAHFRPVASVTTDLPVPVSPTAFAPPSTTSLMDYRLPAGTSIKPRIHVPSSPSFSPPEPAFIHETPPTPDQSIKVLDQAYERSPPNPSARGWYKVVGSKDQ